MAGNEETDPPGHLTEEQYQVTQCGATEAPFTGSYLEEKREGVFRCVVCGIDLFRSEAKYDSGTGWPSFFRPAADDSVEMRLDTGHGMRRTEVICAHCEAHLGHLFDDGPDPTGQRFCINGAALDFHPAAG